MYNPHLESLGCREIDRVQFMDLFEIRISFSSSILRQSAVNFQSRKIVFQSGFPLLSGQKKCGF
jgi:hypothetical protein